MVDWRPRAVSGAVPGVLPDPGPAVQFFAGFPPGTVADPVPAPPVAILEPSPGTPPSPTLRREWFLLALSVLVLLAVVLPPLVNLSRYQHRIVAAMSLSLGREVTLRSVTLRLLPTPALVLADVVVNEDPAFGAEPALRAPRVTAQLRLTSLWRGRFEVSRVEISDASLNLVRDGAGRWNVGSVLLQASHVVNAPTAQRRAGPAPRFPYIQITDSRVNLKQGVEKLPYSLLNANVSMWLAEPEIYRLRLEGQPVRTDVDLGLADIGILRIEGTLHRADALGRIPLALHGDWANAPLGQASRLLLGSDRGWRGDLHAAADVSGDLDHLAIKTRVAIADLHREEFSPPEPFAVDATCRAAYSRAARTLSDLSCRWPVGDGHLLLTGSIAGASDADRMGGESTLALTVEQLPASFLVAAAGLARSDFAPAFHLEGALSGMLFYSAHAGNPPLYAGVLEAPQFRLAAAGLHRPLELNEVRLAAATPSPSGVSTLVLTTAPVDLGGNVPAVINAQITSQGFLLHTSGSASIMRLEELGRATHLLPPALAWLTPQGAAEFDVTRSAGWGAAQLPDILPSGTGAAASRVRELSQAPYATTAVTNGWLRLHNAGYTPRFLSEGVALPAAQATFSPGEMTWSIPAAVFHQVPLQITATYPFDCMGTCVTHFRAACSALDAESLASTLQGTGTDHPLLNALLGRADTSAERWPALEGTIHAETVTLGPLVLRNADATLSIADGKVDIESLNAQALGGSLHGDGSLTVKDGVPVYDLSTVLMRANAASAGMLFHENWGSGALTLSSHLRLSGVDAAQLSASTLGEFRAEWSRGGLGAETPLARFALWTGAGRIENQTITLMGGQLTPGSFGVLEPVTGTIAFDRALALHLGAAANDQGSSKTAADGQSVTVAGTLAHPQPAKP